MKAKYNLIKNDNRYLNDCGYFVKHAVCMHLQRSHSDCNNHVKSSEIT